MNYLNIIFWTALICLFLLLVIYRFLPKSSDKSKWRYVFIALIIALIVTGGVKYVKPQLFNETSGLGSSSTSCSTMVLPESFSKMIGKTENEIAGVLYDQKFKRKKHTYNKENSSTQFIQYIYELFDEDAKSYEDEDIRIPEYVYVLSEFPELISYVVRKREAYNSFFKYLISIGADSLSPDSFSNYSALLGSDLAFSYKNCVYRQCGFMSDNKGYTIQMFRYDLLKNNSMGDEPTEQPDANTNQNYPCGISLNDTKFADLYSSNFISFYNEKGNALEFIGTINNKHFNGNVEIKDNTLTIVSKNCSGKFTLSSDCKKLIGIIDYIYYEETEHFNFEYYKK